MENIAVPDTSIYYHVYWEGYVRGALSELSGMHKEVIDNLESIQGALLRMNRSIQAEGTFGIMKNDRWYKRIVRRGIDSVRLVVFLVSIGQNLYKYHKKRIELKELHKPTFSGIYGVGGSIHLSASSYAFDISYAQKQAWKK